MRILIAEDDAALAGFLQQGLQGEHYAVDVVEDGEQPRAMGSEFDYDLVILDLNLPKLDGVSYWTGSVRCLASRPQNTANSRQDWPL